MRSAHRLKLIGARPCHIAPDDDYLSLPSGRMHCSPIVRATEAPARRVCYSSGSPSRSQAIAESYGGADQDDRCLPRLGSIPLTTVGGTVKPFP